MRFALMATTIVIGACGFDGRSAGSSDADPTVDAASTDAPTSDGAPDTAAVTCAAGAMDTTGVDRGRVGGDGGGPNFPPLACESPAERIVGLAVDISNNTTLYDGRSARAIKIACATVTVGGAGGATVGVVREHAVGGNGEEGWSPSTWTPLTSCTPGSVMTGLLAHRGGEEMNGERLFVNVSIRCSQVLADGTLGATELRYVMGSLTDTRTPDMEMCNAGEIVVSMPNMTGSGLDSVNLFCSPLTCS